MSEHIYYGPWVNWAHGPIIGATLTLGDRSGGFLTAFIATFVTLVGAQLFRILTYIFHQSRSKDIAHDGLWHQQQVVWRNTSSPGTAAWTFLQQSWYWSGKARMAFVRTLPWAMFCVVYMVLFAAAAVFSADISKAPGSARLVIGDTCGYWSQDEGLDIESVKAFAQRLANQSLIAAAYSRSCYGGAYDPLSCSKLPKPSLTTTTKTDAACPFADGMCTTDAFEVSTGMIDSLYDLGINSRHKDRLQYQKIATCAPITQNGFTQTWNGSESAIGRDGDTIYDLMYGPSKLGMTDMNSTNYTNRYNDHTAIDQVAYQLKVATHSAGPLGSVGGWDPTPEVNRTDADVTLVFLSANGISYQEKVDDPIFAAHDVQDLSAFMAGAIYYSADNYVTTMGCVDQYKICNPENNKCTIQAGINQILPWIAYNNDDLDLNIVQQAISIRLMSHSFQGSIAQVLFAAAENALQAKDIIVSGTMSQGLPDNQWQIEVQGWINRGLADLQHQIVEYATGPTHIVPGATLYQPWKGDDSAISLVAESMCYSQMINDSTDTVSFSILGVCILFIFGGLIVFTSLFIDSIVGWIQKKFNIGNHARMCWLLDDKLQLHRYLNQELGHGTWSQEYDTMPNTIQPQEFHTLAMAHEKGLAADEKAAAPRYQHVQQQSTEYQPAQYQQTGYQPPQTTQYQPGTYQPTNTSSPKYTPVVSTEETWMGK